MLEILLQVNCMGVRPGTPDLTPKPTWQVIGALSEMLTEEDQREICGAVQTILTRRIAAEVAKQQ